ncbi:MAG: FmdB family zinc ribbon protein [Candidatus Acidiferrum sp.]
MPLYEYKCLKCNRLTEKIEPVNGPHLKKCPHCGGKVEAQISASAIQFKGSGWYVTDYAGKKSVSGSDGSKEDKSASDKKEAASKDSTKDSGTKETSAKETKETKDTKEKKSEKSAKK